MNTRKIMITLGCAVVGWALCAATMGIGMATTSQQNALTIHAVAAPIIFLFVSLVYYRKFNFTTPVQTALVFTGFIMVLDFFIVALLILHSLEMFASLLGTWIPFAFIFISSWLTGRYVTRNIRYLPEKQAI
jgi:hypothetical protein